MKLHRAAVSKGGTRGLQVKGPVDPEDIRNSKNNGGGTETMCRTDWP